MMIFSHTIQKIRSPNEGFVSWRFSPQLCDVGDTGMPLPTIRPICTPLLPKRETMSQRKDKLILYTVVTPAGRRKLHGLNFCPPKGPQSEQTASVRLHLPCLHPLGPYHYRSEEKQQQLS